MKIVKILFFKFMTIFAEKIVIEGYVEYFNKLGSVDILLKTGVVLSTGCGGIFLGKSYL